MPRPSKFAVEHERFAETVARLDWIVEALDAIGAKVGADMPGKPGEGEPYGSYTPPRRRRPRLEIHNGESADD